MRKFVLLATMLLSVSSSTLVIPMAGQVEHAPTPEQCRADADAWGIPKWAVFVPNEAEFDNLPSVMMHDQTVTAKALDARRTELMVCMKTGSTQSNRYALASRAYAIAELGRMADFMQRHNLTAQFYQEDDQGKR
jgi:hypothetical protein